MKTDCVIIGEEDFLNIKKAAKIIRDGGLVAFPTETVYGLGGNGLNPDSAKKIYAAKGRPSDNPLILHISDLESLETLVSDLPEEAKILAEKFWPGPMTLVLKKSEMVPPETTGGLDTVAIRYPNHKVALDLIREAKVPIAAPSANSSGRPSPTKASHVQEDLDGKIEMILDGGQVGIGIESTIIDLTQEHPVILRPGFITEEMLKEIFKNVSLDKGLENKNEEASFQPKAPGMKYRHYAPKGRLVIYEGESFKVIETINKEIEKAKREGLKTGVLAGEETKDFYRADLVYSPGSHLSPEKIGHNLFDALRRFDDERIDVIFSESFGSGGFSEAVMNRLRKAAGYQIKKVH